GRAVSPEMFQTPSHVLSGQHVSGRSDVGLCMHWDDVGVGVGNISAGEEKGHMPYPISRFDALRDFLTQDEDPSGQIGRYDLERLIVPLRDDLGMARSDGRDIQERHQFSVFAQDDGVSLAGSYFTERAVVHGHLLATLPMPDQKSSPARSAQRGRSYDGIAHPAKPRVASRSWPRWSSTSYSITWSARTSTDCGIVRPSALAVLRLMTSSNRVGRSIGISAGLDPFRTRPTRWPAVRNASTIAGPYAIRQPSIAFSLNKDIVGSLFGVARSAISRP